MFIMTEPTPNPATLKFLPGQAVLESGTANFAGAEAAERSPLGQRLFGIGGVTGVFLGRDFISVSKAEDRDWSVLKPLVLSAIMDHFTSGLPVMEEDGSLAAHSSTETDSDLVVQIKELLDTRVRPAVAQDGGDIVFHGYDNGIVYLHMQGSCAGCPSSTATLKMGIENLLRHYIPEVTEVRAVA
jgi:Fe-S cluster biogenesis protein NfuA